jgi:hypothetical protein
MEAEQIAAALREGGNEQAARALERRQLEKKVTDLQAKLAEQPKEQPGEKSKEQPADPRLEQARELANRLAAARSQTWSVDA